MQHGRRKDLGRRRREWREKRGAISVDEAHVAEGNVKVNSGRGSRRKAKDFGESVPSKTDIVVKKIFTHNNLHTQPVWQAKATWGGLCVLIFRAARFDFQDAVFAYTLEPCHIAPVTAYEIRLGPASASPTSSRTLLDVSNTAANTARALLDLAGSAPCTTMPASSGACCTLEEDVAHKRSYMRRKSSEMADTHAGHSCSSRRRRRGEGRGEGEEWREKGRTLEVHVGVDGAKKELKFNRRRGPEQSA